jgi:hypothetical protein
VQFTAAEGTDKQIQRFSPPLDDESNVLPSENIASVGAPSVVDSVSVPHAGQRPGVARGL